MVTSNVFLNKKYVKIVQRNSFINVKWQGRQDLNLRHPVLETGALPTELLPYTSSTLLHLCTVNGRYGLFYAI